MKPIGQNYIDYWQGFCAVQRGLKNRFGVRVGDGRVWALVQIGDNDASTFGEPHEIPVDPSTLPSYLRMIVDEHPLTYPKSDLVDLLTGYKTFEEAIHSPMKMEPKRA